MVLSHVTYPSPKLAVLSGYVKTIWKTVFHKRCHLQDPLNIQSHLQLKPQYLFFIRLRRITQSFQPFLKLANLRFESITFSRPLSRDVKCFTDFFSEPFSGLYKRFSDFSNSFDSLRSPPLSPYPWAIQLQASYPDPVPNFWL